MELGPTRERLVESEKIKADLQDTHRQLKEQLAQQVTPRAGADFRGAPGQAAQLPPIPRRESGCSPRSSLPPDAP